MTMIKFYYYGMPILMFAQTVLMLYFTASAVYYEGNWYWYSSVCADVLAEYGRNDVDKVDDAIEITAWMPLPNPYNGGDSK